MNIYQEKLLDHYHEPRNYGKLSSFKANAKKENQSCGDSIDIYIDVDEHKRISHISFEGEGCAVAIASASMLSEHAQGKELEQLKRMNMDDLLGIIGMELTLSRMRCASISLDALKLAIANYLDQG